MFRREMGSKRGSLPPKEVDLTCMWYMYIQRNPKIGNPEL